LCAGGDRPAAGSTASATRTSANLTRESDRTWMLMAAELPTRAGFQVGLAPAVRRVDHQVNRPAHEKLPADTMK
jgi:hypothetical protein